ncbi:UNVERIFIED_CONTAM: hypothetical protein HDU68_003347 [Siphonaria sp. JEL0065]|nr:hypothetical protein HDU68_003347 [Siphonaria sp. JEL0065]
MTADKDTPKKDKNSKEDSKYHEKLPVLPTKEQKSVVNAKLSTKKTKSDSKETDKLEPIARTSTSPLKSKQITNGKDSKKTTESNEEIIELGTNPTIPTNNENDTVAIITTIISLNLGDAAPIPKKKEAPKPSIFFDVRERKLFKIPLKHLQMLIDVIHEQGKFTPLLIDPSGRVDTYFTYAGNGLIVDTKKHLVQCDIQKIITKDDVKEDIRRQIVAGLKYGKTMVFVMMNSAFAFKKYYDPGFFPEQVLEEGGIKFRKEEYYEACLRKEDYDEFGRFWINEEFPFRSVVTTLFELEDYEDFLSSNLSLDNFMPIYIEKEAGMV